MWYYGPAFGFPIQDYITILYLFKGRKPPKEIINEDYSVNTGFMHVLLRLLYLFINFGATVNVKLLRIYEQNWS